MSKQRIMFSPVTRLSGLLSVEIIVEQGRVEEANASGTMFRGYEWIMRNRHLTDAVYLTQRICGICSLAHGAMASYLLDELYANELSENAQIRKGSVHKCYIVVATAVGLNPNHRQFFLVFFCKVFFNRRQYGSGHSVIINKR